MQALLDKLAGRTTFDVVTEYAIPIPVDVIGLILGVATQDLPHFRAW